MRHAQLAARYFRDCKAVLISDFLAAWCWHSGSCRPLPSTENDKIEAPKPLSREVEANRKAAGNLTATLPGRNDALPTIEKPRARKDVIRRLREAKGWGQQVLANRAVVSFKTVHSVEQGKPAQLSTFAKIAKALGVEPCKLIDGHDPDSLRPAGGRGKCVEVKLTLSIPFGEFDETDGLDRLTAFLTSVIEAKNAIIVDSVAPGSVEVSLLVDEKDAPRLIQAFAGNQLEPIQAVELVIPRKVALHYVAGIVAMGFANPVIVPVLPFAAFLLAIHRLQDSGIDVAFLGGDLLRLKRMSSAGPANTEPIPSLAAVDPSLIRQAIEVVTPDSLLPALPCSVTLRLDPNASDGPSSVTLGERLESLLVDQERLRPKVSPRAAWRGLVG